MAENFMLCRPIGPNKNCLYTRAAIRIDRDSKSTEQSDVNIAFNVYGRHFHGGDSITCTTEDLSRWGRIINGVGDIFMTGETS